MTTLSPSPVLEFSLARALEDPCSFPAKKRRDLVDDAEEDRECSAPKRASPPPPSLSAFPSGRLPSSSRPLTVGFSSVAVAMNRRALDADAPDSTTEAPDSPEKPVVKTAESVRAARTVVFDYLLAAMRRSKSHREFFIGLKGRGAPFCFCTDSEPPVFFQSSCSVPCCDCKAVECSESHVRETLLASDALTTPLVFGAFFMFGRPGCWILARGFCSDVTARDMEQALRNDLQWRSAGDPVVLTDWFSAETAEHNKSAHPVAAALARVDHPSYFTASPPSPARAPHAETDNADPIYCRHFFSALVPRLNECQL